MLHVGVSRISNYKHRAFGVQNQNKIIAIIISSLRDFLYSYKKKLTKSPILSAVTMAAMT